MISRCNTLFSVLATMITTGCADEALKASPHAFVPDAFHVAEGGPFSGYAIQVRQGKVIHFTLNEQGRRETKLSMPSSERWAAFYKRLRSLRVEKWSEEYVRKPSAVQISDGSRWIVRIIAPGLKVESRGTNAFPSDSDSTAADQTGLKTRAFRQIEDALRQLFDIDELYRQ